MLFFAVVFITLHGPDGREVDLSVDAIASVHCKMPNVENKLFTEGTNAVISTADGKNIAVKETCFEVRDIIEKAQQ